MGTAPARYSRALAVASTWRDGQYGETLLIPDLVPTALDLEPTAPDLKRRKQPKRKKRVKKQVKKRVRKSHKPIGLKYLPGLGFVFERTETFDTIVWLAKDQERHKQQVRASLWSDS